MRIVDSRVVADPFKRSSFAKSICNQERVAWPMPISLFTRLPHILAVDKDNYPCGGVSDSAHMHMIWKNPGVPNGRPGSISQVALTRSIMPQLGPVATNHAPVIHPQLLCSRYKDLASHPVEHHPHVGDPHGHRGNRERRTQRSEMNPSLARQPPTPPHPPPLPLRRATPDPEVLLAVERVLAAETTTPEFIFSGISAGNTPAPTRFGTGSDSRSGSAGSLTNCLFVTLDEFFGGWQVFRFP